MRRAALAATLILLLAAASGANGAATASKTILGVSGNTARFQTQTQQKSLVDQAFLAWGQGQTFGSPFVVLFKTLQPIPMIHLGTNAKGSKTKAAISTAQIAAGKGDAYLVALNQAISQWGRAIYVRPMAEMNNPGNPWHGDPASYRKAFARIYLIVHGGATVNARLQSLGMPPVKTTLASNPMPRVRVLWSPLAGGDAPDQYWPGDAYVDVGGGDIYQEDHAAPPWQKLTDLFTFSKAHGKPFSVPEWGLFGVDVPKFVQDMCTFLKSHATETAEFYESKPGSIFDLQPKPQSRSIYRTCITPSGGPAPSWAAGGPGSAKQLQLSLTPDPDTGDAPLDVTFSIEAKLTVPIVQWQVVFGDGAVKSGTGQPPDSVDHTYTKDGTYQAVLVVYQGPPFTGTAVRFLTTASVTVGIGNDLIRFKATPASGKAPLKVVFQADTHLPRPVAHWQIVFGDGLTNQGDGAPPHFAGHTYTQPGKYRVLLILDQQPQFTGTATRFIAYADVTVK
jgi:PKD repeat protein